MLGHNISLGTIALAHRLRIAAGLESCILVSAGAHAPAARGIAAVLHLTLGIGTAGGTHVWILVRIWVLSAKLALIHIRILCAVLILIHIRILSAVLALIRIYIGILNRSGCIWILLIRRRLDRLPGSRSR